MTRHPLATGHALRVLVGALGWLLLVPQLLFVAYVIGHCSCTGVRSSTRG